MLGWVIQLLISQKERKVLYQDIQKLLQWFSAAYFLWRQISTALSPWTEFCSSLQKHNLSCIDIEVGNRFEELREALGKLQLNDAALKVGFISCLWLYGCKINRLAWVCCQTNLVVYVSNIWRLGRSCLDPYIHIVVHLYEHSKGKTDII